MSEDSDIATAGAARRGARARMELVETRAAFDAMRVAMLDAIVTTAPEHTRRIDRLIAGIQVIDGIRKALETTVREGESVQTYRQMLDETLGPQELAEAS
jgi:hypothetical protein